MNTHTPTPAATEALNRQATASVQDRLREPSHNVFLTVPNSLDAIFAPKNVALVGATEKQGSVGRTILWNLISSPFGGTIYPVNPKRDNILGIPAYASLKDIPAKVDLVVVVTPASTVPAIIEEAASLNIPGAVVISAGFKEVGPEGVELERQILETAKASNMRIVGPNCLGVMNTTTGLNATFASGMANAGNVAFISQSGALCTAVLDWSYSNNVGFSVFASIGSMLDVNWGDLIYHLGNDKNTQSIVIYMETIGDARAFLSAAREVALEKPIIVIKPGRTDEASAAAASHTGSLTGSDSVLDAAFKRCGVLRVDTIEEVFSMAQVLGKQPLPKGPRLNIITNAGGPSVIATDALVSAGGELAQPSPETIEALNEFLPSAWSHANPIDILGDASPERYARTLKVMAEDDNSDGSLVILTPQAMTNPTETAQQLMALSRNPNKPVLASWMGGRDVEGANAVLNKVGIPTFPYPDSAARAFSLMWQYSKNLKSLYETPSSQDVDDIGRIPKEEINASLRAVRETGRTILTEKEAKELLSTYGIPVTQTVLTQSPDEAVGVAEKMGFPVVMKLNSETITHKSDVGGVQLNIRTADGVRDAFEAIKTNLAKHGFAEHFDGVTVQPMISTKGTELLLGCTYDPQFGPVIAFGAGGIYVELFKDVAFGLPPLNGTLCKRMIEETKVSHALGGIRGQAPVDMAKLEDMLIRFSYLISRHPLIKEIEINPLLASGEQIIALDARVVLHEASTLEDEIQPNVLREYPFEYVQQWQGKKGDAFTIRPIRADDEARMRAFHERVSEDSARHTFARQFALDDRISHQRLSRVCFNDFDREITLIALNHQDEMNGIVRLSKFNINRAYGVFRLLVQDDTQGQGLGSELLERLINIARTEGLKEMIGLVLPDNQGMLNLVKHHGFSVAPLKDNDQMLEARLSL
jgi:acetyltransferase